MKQTLTVIAAIIDVKKLTLYSITGNMLIIPQGDPRIKPIVEQLMNNPPSGHNPIEVDISERISDTVFDEFSRISKTEISFVRVAKQFLASLADLLGIQKEPSTGNLFEEGSSDVVNQIMSQAQPTGKVMADSTVVAIVDGVAIPGAENLYEQVKFANEAGTKGMETFLSRMATVMARRQHSAEDLLKFLQKGDLPIADDGSIIAYKLLNKTGDNYVDCHSGKVTQRVGDIVRMAEFMVDPNRRQNCSNGLHVARRDYLSNFSGNVCTLIKIAPEDVIAVPLYDGSKMRVCAYRIIAELPESIRNLLQNNRPMTDSPEGQDFMAKAIAGNYPPMKRQVTIGGQLGTNLTIADLEQSTEEKPIAVTKVVKALEQSIDTSVHMAPDVSPSSVGSTHSGGSKRVQIAMELLKQMQQAKEQDAKKSAASNLKAFKKTSKVSWEKLGLSQTEVAIVEKLLQ